jgi:pyrroloquinoline quinone (PQQ) biosynthesis protein C
MDSNAFVKELKRTVKDSEYALVRSPFVRGVTAGTLTRAQLKGWALQDYQYRRHVPQLAATRFTKCTDAKIRAELFETLIEEGTGAVTGSAGHTELFFDLAKELGASLEELEAEEPLAETAAHLYWAELILHTKPWFIALSAQLGGEGQVQDFAGVLVSGLKQQYGLSDRALRFWTVHLEADKEHSSVVEEMVARFVVTDEFQDEVRKVVRTKLRLLHGMWSTFRYF